MNYTYTLNGTPVTPLGKWEIEFRRNKGQIFFRRYLSGEKLIFQGADYDYLLTFDECTELTFIIYCDGVSFWTGKFSYPYSFEFDTDQCWAKGTPDVVDEYSCIMDKYNLEYSQDSILLSLDPEILDIYLYPCTGGGTPLIVQPFHGYSIYDILNELINAAHLMDCDYDLASSYFWRDNFPNGDNYAASYGTDNYVTGDPNRLEYIYLTPNYGVIPRLAGAVGKCNITETPYTFSWFEKILRERFNAYWYIDENGDIRIEHISFFLPGFAHSDFCVPLIDLTTRTYRGETYAERHNKYTFLIEDLFDQEVWIWEHYLGTEGGVAHNQDFEGDPIYYGANEGEKSDCVPGEFKKKESSTPKLWTDIDWASQLADPEATIKCDGWLMVDVDLTATPDQIRCETGHLSNVNILNGHCSTANLMAHYFTWDRIFLTGHMNHNATPPQVEITVFNSAIRKKLQEEIEFPVCCDGDFDPMDCVKTEMGNGMVYEAIQTMKSIKVKLLYD